ncbi:MAG: PepSY domain-containing protein [Croceibacterium sp.]
MAGLVWFHRWLGVATCLVFAMWFATGAVMLFNPFPSVSTADRTAFAAPLDTSAIRVGPAEALRLAGGGSGEVRLVQRNAAPAYVIHGEGTATVVDAQNGAVLPLLAPAAVGADRPPQVYDQWTVANGLDPYRPLYRIPRGDVAGTVDYVSAVTGELVQRTTASDRAWNWAGSVLHWIYFTPLRSNWAVWDQTVWWLSLVCSLVALAGIVLGILRSATALRQKRRALTYFRARWLRWHHLLGLFAGIFVLTWIVSGWLSMDHGRLFSRGQATERQALAYAGGAGVTDVTVATLRGIGPASEIQFSALGGQTILSVTRPVDVVDRLDAAGRALSDHDFEQMLSEAIIRAWPQARLARLEAVAPNDLYRGNEGWPDSVRRADLSGKASPDLYVDANTGRLLTVMDQSRAAYAWAYYGLHTFKFPGLAEHPILRKGLVLALLLIGFLFSVTGAIIAWRRLRPVRSPQPSGQRT